MVRCYSGDIKGSFWYGIQGSGDIGNLIKIQEQNIYRWYGCGCAIVEPALAYNDYCKFCYSNKKAFVLEALKEIGDKPYEHLYKDTKQFYYDISAEKHLEELEFSLHHLRFRIDPRIISEIEKVENTEAIRNAFSGVFDKMMTVYHDIREINPSAANPDYVSRYCLGIQIRYRLKTHVSCYVRCEL